MREVQENKSLDIDHELGGDGLRMKKINQVRMREEGFSEMSKREFKKHGAMMIGETEGISKRDEPIPLNMKDLLATNDEQINFSSDVHDLTDNHDNVFKTSGLFEKKMDGMFVGDKAE